jgi:hypothetical protein
MSEELFQQWCRNQQQQVAMDRLRGFLSRDPGEASFRPMPPPEPLKMGKAECYPAQHLTESDVRRIIREELERAK